MYFESMKFELSSNIYIISLMLDRRKRRVPENLIKSRVSALPIKAFSLFCGITTRAL
jgi:hypothetical protein